MNEVTAKSIWAISIEGHEFDLEDSRKLFTEGPTTVRIQTIADGHNITALLSDDFDQLEKPGQVREVAIRLLDWINGVLFLHEATRAPLKVGQLYRYFDN